jgi:hypothetical protein
MTAGIFFTSAEHKQRLLSAMQCIGKIDDGKLDPEYASALYILTSSAGTWQKASGYVDRGGIDFEAMLEELDFSGGYSILIKLASNLFNSNMHIDPIEFLRLDETNFMVALTSIQLRRSSLKENLRDRNS